MASSAMLITKKVHDYIEGKYAPYTMYWKIGAGWVAMDWAATKFRTDESVKRWGDRALETLKENETIAVVAL